MTSSTGRLVLIAWGLALAIALVLLIPITVRAQTAREVDLSQVPPEMRPAFVDAIDRMPPDFLGGRALAVVSMRLEQNWALATLAVQDASLEDNGMGANGALVILRSDGQDGWQAGIEGTPDYDKLVPLAPEVLISAPAKRILMVPGPAAPDIAAMKFPWDSSQSWYLTQGWHYGNHVDFAPLRSEPNKWVLAAHAGTVTRVCVGGVSANLQLRHSDGTITTYSHFDKNEIVTPTLGTYVQQGRILGKLYNSSFSQDGCGYSSGPHVHFGVPTQTVTVDGWTADSANNWTRDGVVKHEGDRFSSSNVRNEGDPSLPDAFGKLSPTNGATGQLTALTLDWGDSASATGYEYCVDSTNDNLCDGAWVSVGSSTAAVVNNLAAQVTYYWQVRALSA
ncbi:MAG: M23 family metallopeptidase, partial [Chloroflexi bacterium]|nr:M23 family metallopeptidase [Chloroflexota bacterium]